MITYCRDCSKVHGLPWGGFEHPIWLGQCSICKEPGVYDVTTANVPSFIPPKEKRDARTHK